MNEATFEKAVFASGVTFNDTVFQASCAFDDATFGADIAFRSTRFGTDASFQRTKFEGIVTFQSSGFGGNADFRAATFHRPATFSNCTFGRAVFDGSVFEDKADFSNASFQGGDARFEDGMFSGDATFQNTRFAKVTFNRRTFGGYANFLDSLFYSDASFCAALFASRVDFSCSAPQDFHVIEFNDAEFRADSFFVKRRFTRTTNFSSAKFAIPPQFHDAELHQDTDFEGTSFGDTKHSGAERSFRTLKLAMSEHQNHVQELRFFALEMESRRHRETSFWTKFLMGAYKHLSNYGQDVLRPTVLLLVNAIGFFLLYWLWVDLGLVWKCAWTPECRLGFNADKAGAIAQFTLAQSVPFLSLFKDVAKSSGAIFGPDAVPISVQLLAVLQGLLTLLFAFLLGLGLRNLFRLR